MTDFSLANITKGIRTYYPVSDESLGLLFGKFKRLELPKKSLIMKAGVINRHVYFIEKGFARSYCLHEGKETTIWFSREGDITFAMKDLYHDEPGYENVELLEESVLYAIHVKDLNELTRQTSKLPTGEGSSIRNACYTWTSTTMPSCICRPKSGMRYS